VQNFSGKISLRMSVIKLTWKWSDDKKFVTEIIDMFKECDLFCVIVIIR
jgi:hypothetical protein